MSLYYEGSDGTKINLMDNGIYAQNPESLTASHWTYNTISGVNGIGKIKSFYKETQEASLTLDIMAKNADEFNAMMYKMHKSFERDILRKQPGKIWWNGFYKEVFIVEQSHSDFEELFESIQKELKLISVHPYWIKKNTFQFCNLLETYGKLDYGSAGFYAGFDFGSDTNAGAGFDYDQSEYIEVIQNNCIYDANFELIFYGPASNPSVTIGEHEYELNVELGRGEYATINSATKKIFHYTVDGEQTNIFHLRNRDSYIFKKIPEGSTSILRNIDILFDISLFDERGEPEWI